VTAPAPDASPLAPPPDPDLADVRVVLLQARSEPAIQQQEVECFAERSRIRPAQIRAVSVLDGGLGADVLDGADALMIGGAGAYDAYRDYDWMPSLLGLVQRVVERGLPTFGSCWGHQIIARALGGEVRHDAQRAEMGTLEVRLTDAGTRDALFSRLPRTFLANQGHHDRVTRLPAGAVELAVSSSQPHQAFRLGDAPIFGTQFHPELDAARERERLVFYRDYYPEGGSDEEFAALLGALHDTTHADDLLWHFLRQFAA
jgi:GMP synthase (glutamine-hydrolysing)